MVLTCLRRSSVFSETAKLLEVIYRHDSAVQLSITVRVHAGYVQSPVGFRAQMLYGQHFEPGTTRVASWTQRFVNSSGSTGAAPGFSFNAKPSVNIRLDKTTGAGAQGGLVNRGIGGSGFVFQAGQPYIFELYSWSVKWAGGAAPAVVELRDFTAGTVLARADFTAGNGASAGQPGDSIWNYYNVTLTPSASTSCVSIPWDSDPTIDCGGA